MYYYKLCFIDLLVDIYPQSVKMQYSYVQITPQASSSFIFVEIDWIM
jgi:hypothetical protein